MQEITQAIKRNKSVQNMKTSSIRNIRGEDLQMSTKEMSRSSFLRPDIPTRDCNWPFR